MQRYLSQPTVQISLSAHMRLPHPLIWAEGLHSTSSFHPAVGVQLPDLTSPCLAGLLPVCHSLPESMASGEDPTESSAVPGVAVGNSPPHRDPSAISSRSSGSWLVFLKARVFFLRLLMFRLYMKPLDFSLRCIKFGVRGRATEWNHASHPFCCYE